MVSFSVHDDSEKETPTNPNNYSLDPGWESSPTARGDDFKNNDIAPVHLESQGSRSHIHWKSSPNGDQTTVRNNHFAFLPLACS
jgi:hypothetical protein